MKTKARIARIILLSAVGVSSAFACAWNFVSDHSVRFNSERSGRGFYRLPPLPISYDPVTGKELAVNEYENYSEMDDSWYEQQEAVLSAPSKIWEQATTALEAGDVSSAAKRFAEYLEETIYADTDGSEHQQARRNAAYDILDAFAERKRGASDASVIAYAKARRALQETGVFSPISPEEGTAVPNSLKDNWAYLNAAALYSSGNKAEALTAFRRHAQSFPQSEKNESVIYMIGKLLMEQGDACDEEACEIREYASAVEQFERILQKYPNGRYVFDARGWLAHLYKHQNKTADSLAEYYRLLGNTKDPQWRLEAKKSLQILGHEQDDITLDKVEALIANDPDAALAYAYHRIYNHAVDLSYAEYNPWCCYGDEKWAQSMAERKRVFEEKNKGSHELRRIANFAAMMTGKFGTSRVSGEFLLRLAQANLELEDFRKARSYSQEALRHGVLGNARAEALWIKGSSDHALQDLSAARTTFSRLVSEFPDHKLTEGARRLLAITAEDQGDLEFALDQYAALGYKYDIAYFVDVLLSSEQLAKYLETRKTSPKYNEFRYALGVRYLRERRWQAARDVLRSVKAEPEVFNAYAYEDESERPIFPKSPGWNYGQERDFIRDTWVMRDIATTYALESLERKVEDAGDDEAKAEAMYQLASYYFQSSDLLLYNPMAWDGARYSLLGEFPFQQTISSEDRHLIFDHSRSHDTLARAIPIYLEIVDRFPGTRAAQDALYSAAVAHERLSGLNPYWRWIYGNGLFAGSRYVSYDDVRRTYPNYQLPRGTYGWEPSTRTVNGGPGWAPKPKAPPKLTTEQRIVRKLGKWKSEYGPWLSQNASWARNGIKSTARSAYERITFWFTGYVFIIYFGLVATPFWTHRRQLYHGPITKGAILAHRGLTFVARKVADWWRDIAVPSIR